MTELPARRYHTWLACLFLVLGTLAIYWPARHYGFVDYDDNDYVFNNPTVRAGLSWWGLVWSFVDQHANNWHPLTWLSHMLDCELFGLDPGPAHVVNVLFHCANAVLLFLLLNSMTGAFWRNAIVAALFAWHPLHVESVAWISERKDVLSGFFFMLTLWMYVLHVKRETIPFLPNSEERLWTKFTSSSPRLFYYKLSLGFFVLGLLSKPMLVTVPLVLLLIDFWPLNRFDAGSTKESILKTAKRLFTEKLPFLAFSIIVAIITFLAQREGGATSSGQPLGFFSRIGEALIGYMTYLEKLFWPHDLACLYLRPDHVNLTTLAAAIIAITGISILAAALARRRPYLITGWLWFLIMLLPVSGVVQFGLQSVADRYTYLPSIGFFIVCVWTAAELSRTLFPPMTRQLLLGIMATVILTGCALLSRQQLAYWQNTQTLMEQALKIDPANYVAHDDLGVYFSKMGRTREALAQYQLARELDPNLRQPPESLSISNSLKSSFAPK